MSRNKYIDTFISGSLEATSGISALTLSYGGQNTDVRYALSGNLAPSGDYSTVTQGNNLYVNATGDFMTGNLQLVSGTDLIMNDGFIRLTDLGEAGEPAPAQLGSLQDYGITMGGTLNRGMFIQGGRATGNMPSFLQSVHDTTTSEVSGRWGYSLSSNAYYTVSAPDGDTNSWRGASSNRTNHIFRNTDIHGWQFMSAAGVAGDDAVITPTIALKIDPRNDGTVTSYINTVISGRLFVSSTGTPQVHVEYNSQNYLDMIVEADGDINWLLTGTGPRHKFNNPIAIVQDNVSMRFGLSSDATIEWDGNQLVIDSTAVSEATAILARGRFNMEGGGNPSFPACDSVYTAKGIIGGVFKNISNNWDTYADLTVKSSGTAAITTPEKLFRGDGLGTNSSMTIANINDDFQVEISGNDGAELPGIHVYASASQWFGGLVCREAVWPRNIKIEAIYQDGAGASTWRTIADATDMSEHKATNFIASFGALTGIASPWQWYAVRWTCTNFNSTGTFRLSHVLLGHASERFADATYVSWRDEITIQRDRGSEMRQFITEYGHRDQVKQYFGNADDASIRWTGSNVVLDVGAGSLLVTAVVSGTTCEGTNLIYAGQDTDARYALSGNLAPSGNYATVTQGHNLWQASGLYATSGDYVQVAGDTMTGELTIKNSLIVSGNLSISLLSGTVATQDHFLPITNSGIWTGASRAFPIYDVAGTLLGYVPIYAAKVDA